MGDHRPGTIDYDAELRLHNEVLRRAYSLRRDEYVLDIGCGTGKTTREAARIAVDGSVVGIDVSQQMIDRSWELTEARLVKEFKLLRRHYRLFVPSHASTSTAGSDAST